MSSSRYCSECDQTHDQWASEATRICGLCGGMTERVSKFLSGLRRKESREQAAQTQTQTRTAQIHMKNATTRYSSPSLGRLLVVGALAASSVGAYADGDPLAEAATLIGGYSTPVTTAAVAVIAVFGIFCLVKLAKKVLSLI